MTVATDIANQNAPALQAARQAAAANVPTVTVPSATGAQKWDPVGILKTTNTYDASTPFGKYLNAHPGQGDAWAALQSLLDEYGLSDLYDFAQQQMIAGSGSDQVVTSMRETNAYKTRFSGLIERQQKGLAPISEKEAVALERSYQQQARLAGLPDGMLTAGDYQKLIAGDVSTQEFGDRVLQGYVDLQQQPDQVRGEFSRLGFGDGAALSTFLDPEKAEPLLTKQLAAAKLSGQALMSGYGGLTAQQALGLAGQGVTAAQGAQGFGTLSQQNALFSPLASESNAIDKNVGIEATFNNNADAARQLQTRQKERQAAFNGGGNYATSKSGLTGAGASNT